MKMECTNEINQTAIQFKHITIVSRETLCHYSSHFYYKQTMEDLLVTSSVSRYYSSYRIAHSSLIISQLQTN